MRKVALVVLALATMGMGAPSHAATVGANAAVQQSLFMSFYGPQPAGGYKQGDLYVTNFDGATSDGSGVTPVTTYTAGGDYFACDSTNTCTYDTFPQQQISPTAFSVDPAGNSGTFTACLMPQTPSVCVPVALSFVQPRNVSYCACVLPNAWVDPGSKSASGTASSYVSVMRNGYTYSGTIAGAPLTGVYTFDQYATYLPAGVGVLAP